ncbi:MAG: EVE domain-containing protein [Caulobacteraceae bacterium]|nr:EVE domain-containing protein [Caulobacteraceae bacterium]
MAYWLIKSEPDTWSWNQHVKKGADSWTGVRNHQAKVHLQTMKKGDKAFFYHSNEGKEIVGVSEVVKAYIDPTDSKNAFFAVDFKAVEPLKTPVSLATLKADKHFADMVLVKNSRLSVQPVTADEWKAIRKMGGLK